MIEIFCYTENVILLLFFAFLSGLVTILAPCIWPLLPIILSSTVAGKGHKRPLGITLGIMLSFAFFTLTISWLVQLFHFNPAILRFIAVIVLGFLGLTMIIPSLSNVTELLISRLATSFGLHNQRGNGFTAGFVTGLALGIVWSPCAGPILAAIATLAATGQVTLTVVAITLAYVCGIGIPLFLFSYGGQQLFTKARFISAHTGRIQQVFGVIMLVTAAAIYTNYDTFLQAQLLNAFPQFTSTIDSFEKNSTVKQQLDVLRGKQSSISDTIGLFNVNIEAPDFVGINKWLNTEKPLKLKDLQGKVVLVDFWTYTCINCIRTLPYVTAWYDKYKDQGFTVIGVHTPEFAFEHETTNVETAIQRYGIHYPVAQDNDYATWNNYSNEYWPAEYLIDAQGKIRRVHFGEGEYDQTELAIQTLLKESGKHITASLEQMPDQTPHEQLSPETYLGARRMEYYYPEGVISTGKQKFTLEKNLPRDTFSLGGEWEITDEDAITGSNAVLSYNFLARKVFLVLRPGTAGEHAKVKVFLDGVSVDTLHAGTDVKNGVVTIDSDRLYNLIDLKGGAENHTLRLEFQSPGIEAFAFTFG